MRLGRTPDRSAGGFTLMELLVIIAIVLLLIGLMVPSLQHGYRMVMRVRCGSNMSKWYTALCGYGADNGRYFPENISGSARHISWCSQTMGVFWRDYLLQWDKERIQGGYDVLFCPVQDWHRTDGALRDLFGLCGFFYMPHRDNTP